MSIAIASIGTKVSYAFESVAGVMPTSGYKLFPKMTATPDLNTTPDTAETTSFDDLEYTSSRAMLKSLDTLEFTARLSQDLYDMYMGVGGLIETYEANKAQGLGMWVCIKLRELNKAFFLPVEPVTLGLPPIDTNTVVDVTLYFSKIADPVWASEPTYVTDTNCLVTVSTVSEGTVVTAIKDGIVRAQVTAGENETSVTMNLPYDSVNGTVYTFVAALDGLTPTSFSAVAKLTSSTASVSGTLA